MAKIKGTFITNLKGRVGNVVYRTRAGENIASERPATVKNPRSYAQQTQRMAMSTVIQAYSGLKELCDHSFEGVSNGAESMAKFMSLNLNIMKGKNSNFNLKGNASPIPNPYIIAKGSLNEPAFETYGYSGVLGTFMELTDVPQTDIADLTVQQLHDFLGIELGDQITFVDITIDPSGSGYGDDYMEQPPYKLIYSRVIFKLTSGALPITLSTPSATTYLEWNAEALDLEKSYNYNNAKLLAPVGSSRNMLVGFPDDKRSNDATGMEGVVTGAGIIISRKSNDKWLRSTSRIKLLGEEEFTSEMVIRSYNPSDPLYLNNALS